MRTATRIVLPLAALTFLAACAPAAPDAQPSATAPTAPTASDAAFITGLTIPWAVGGERIRRDGTKGNDPGEWPPFPVAATRLWDTRTTWLHLEPADGQWNWTTLDAHLAKAAAEGVGDVTLVLAGTPRWAAIRETDDDAPWLGPGSASPPKDVEQWRDFVATTASRYRGQIDAYEIGNEPNLATFWNGTSQEYAELVSVAADAIGEADPDARIVVNAGLVRGERDLDALARWLGPLAEGTDGDPRAAIDVVSVHLYPEPADLPDVPELLQGIRTALANAGFGGMPAWVTEVNVQDGSSLPTAQQGSAVATLTRQIDDAGFARAYWYAWTDLGPENLVQFSPGEPGARALAEATP